jgi:anti-repressor protein
MNALIKIESSSIGGEPKDTVNARELYIFLGVMSKFADWMKNQIERARLVENQDYVTFSKNLESGGAIKEYHLTIEAGKSIGMMSATDRGFEIRDYFIECENRLKNQSPALQIAHAMLLAGKMIEDQKLQIAEMQPKADFFDAVTGSTTAVDMAIVAKTLNMGIGRNQLFEFLRERAILDRHNIPYQEYCNRGYFRVVESQYNKPDGSSHINFKTVVFQKGLDFIRRKYSESQEVPA